MMCRSHSNIVARGVKSVFRIVVIDGQDWRYIGYNLQSQGHKVFLNFKEIHTVAFEIYRGHILWIQPPVCLWKQQDLSSHTHTLAGRRVGVRKGSDEKKRITGFACLGPKPSVSNTFIQTLRVFRSWAGTDIDVVDKGYMMWWGQDLAVRLSRPGRSEDISICLNGIVQVQRSSEGCDLQRLDLLSRDR